MEFYSIYCRHPKLSRPITVSGVQENELNQMLEDLKDIGYTGMIPRKLKKACAFTVNKGFEIGYARKH